MGEATAQSGSTGSTASAWVVAEVPVEALLEVRSVVLREGKDPEKCYFPEDEVPGAWHLAALDGDDVVGSISAYPAQAPIALDVPADGPVRAIRIRGMATLPQVRGTGAGSALLAAALERASDSADAVWCNARASAVEFYERHGFQDTGIEINVPFIGRHLVLYRAV